MLGYNSIIFIYAIFTAVSLHTILFLDLYLTLRSPFVQREKRLKKYYAFVTLVFIIISIVLYNYPGILGCNVNIFNMGNRVINRDLFWILNIILHSLAIIMIISFIGTLRIVCISGTSNKLRRKVLFKIIIYSINYMLQQVYVGFMFSNDR